MCFINTLIIGSRVGSDYLFEVMVSINILTSATTVTWQWKGLWFLLHC